MSTDTKLICVSRREAISPKSLAATRSDFILDWPEFDYDILHCQYRIDDFKEHIKYIHVDWRNADGQEVNRDIILSPKGSNCWPTRWRATLKRPLPGVYVTRVGRHLHNVIHHILEDTLNLAKGTYFDGHSTQGIKQ